MNKLTPAQKSYLIELSSGVNNTKGRGGNFRDKLKAMGYIETVSTGKYSSTEVVTESGRKAVQ